MINASEIWLFAQQQAFLVGTAILLVVLFLLNEWLHPDARLLGVDTQAIILGLNQGTWHIVDLRPSAAFKTEHFPQSISMPFEGSPPNWDSWETQFKKLSWSKHSHHQTLLLVGNLGQTRQLSKRLRTIWVGDIKALPHPIPLGGALSQFSPNA